jgi:signal transduction histidine kinase
MDDARFAEMISKIAHELRSPLTSVKGFSATLLGRWDRFTDEQKYELIETIHHDAERMGRIVSEVLDLARVESGRLELNRAPTSLAELIEAALAHLSKYPEAARVEQGVAGDLEVFVDKERMLHVIENLIENAIKFSDEGPIEVRAREESGQVLIEVADRGVGIEAKRIQDVFSGPAPRGGKATPSGTGLGLYLSKKLVEAHGGSISAVSDPGVLTTFTVRLPSGST